MTVDEDARTLPDRARLRWFLVGSVALISFSAFESLAVGTVLPRAAAEFGATAEYSVAFGAASAMAQDLQDRPVPPPPPEAAAAPASEDEIRFTADRLDYDTEADVVTATGDVRMFPQ